MAVRGGDRGRQAEQRGFLGQWNYCIWCHNGHMSLHFCQNPQGIRHREWTPMWTTDCGCQWRVTGVHGLSQMHPSAGGCWWWGVLCWRWMRGTREIFAPSALFCCELKTALKNKVYLKHKTSRGFARRFLNPVLVPTLLGTPAGRSPGSKAHGALPDIPSGPSSQVHFYVHCKLLIISGFCCCC